jgi:hypothetical protein
MSAHRIAQFLALRFGILLARFLDNGSLEPGVPNSLRIDRSRLVVSVCRIARGGSFDGPTRILICKVASCPSRLSFRPPGSLFGKPTRGEFSQELKPAPRHRFAWMVVIVRVGSFIAKPVASHY